MPAFAESDEAADPDESEPEVEDVDGLFARLSVR